MSAAPQPRVTTRSGFAAISAVPSAESIDTGKMSSVGGRALADGSPAASSDDAPHAVRVRATAVAVATRAERRAMRTGVLPSGSGSSE